LYATSIATTNEVRGRCVDQHSTGQSGKAPPPAVASHLLLVDLSLHQNVRFQSVRWTQALVCRRRTGAKCLVPTWQTARGGNPLRSESGLSMLPSLPTTRTPRGRASVRHGFNSKRLSIVGARYANPSDTATPPGLPDADTWGPKTHPHPHLGGLPSQVVQLRNLKLTLR
jgi:hypothetical protein